MEIGSEFTYFAFTPIGIDEERCVSERLHNRRKLLFCRHQLCMIMGVHQAFARDEHRLGQIPHVLLELMLVLQHLQWNDISDDYVTSFEFIGEQRTL